MGILCILRSIPAGGVTCVWWRRGWWAPTCLSHPPSTQPDTSVCLQGVEKEQGVHQLPNLHLNKEHHKGDLILGYPPSAQSDTIAILEGNKNKELVKTKVVVAHHLSDQGEQLQGG